MKKIAVFLLLLMAAAMAEEVSLDKALTLALVDYPGLNVQPQSKPSQLAVTSDGSYWVIEFDDIWVPVTRNGTVLKEQESEAIGAYKVHYSLQKIIEQRDKKDYPVNHDSSLTLMLGDVENKISYLVSYKPQLPPDLQSGASTLVEDAQDLKSSIISALNTITVVKAEEDRILYAPANYSDFREWRREFTGMLDAFSDVAERGYAYNDARTQFNLQAQAFLNSSNDTAQKETVQAFVSGIAISNIPGSLPGLESSVSQWKTSWVNVALTDNKIEADCKEIYIKYKEFWSGETVASLRGTAYEKVSALGLTVPLLLDDLGKCERELTAKQQTSLRELNRTYTNAAGSYTAGASYEKSLKGDKAREAYLNAISWSEKAKVLESQLSDVECPAATPTPKPAAGPVEFLTSIWGVVLAGLVVLLIVLYWWNNKKKGEGYADEYSPDY